VTPDEFCVRIKELLADVAEVRVEWDPANTGLMFMVVRFQPELVVHYGRSGVIFYEANGTRRSYVEFGVHEMKGSLGVNVETLRRALPVAERLARLEDDIWSMMEEVSV